MNPKVSVIIPVYKIENYIRRCVDSVLHQTYDNLEILLVDDGSPDACPDICDDYSQKDSRICVLHKKNGGLSDARNYGTLQATGEYILFLDGDDWLTVHAVEHLVKAALGQDADIVQGAFYYAYSTYLLLDNAKKQTHGQLVQFSREQAMEELLINRAIKNFAWGKLIRTSLVQSHTFLKGVYFEDSYWIYQLIHEIKKYVIIPTPVCYYRQREESISGCFSVKNLDLLKGTEQRCLFIRANYPQFASKAFNFLWKLSFDFLRLSFNSEMKVTEAYKQYWEYLSTTYQQEFYRARKESLYIKTLYELNKRSQFFLRLFLILERIYSRFTPSTLTKIHYEDTLL